MSLVGENFKHQRGLGTVQALPKRPEIWTGPRHASRGRIGMKQNEGRGLTCDVSGARGFNSGTKRPVHASVVRLGGSMTDLFH